MKITNLSYITPLKVYSKPKFDKNNNTQNPIEQTPLPKMFAYRDFNISFAGRTPEDFYTQDFNIENMPKAMKTYLNYDKEQRQHMPPEQMMYEVFKRLDGAENLLDVKNIYPHEVEPLFDNLHSASIKSRKGILSEIKVARDLSDTPLLKDGSDDFGLYLLKKIYKEGKTLKEISKDFLEKDISDEYKGFITAPIDYSTTSAYGIKFPNHAFWHSFISTRDDYKAFFITLPKNTVDPNKIAVSGSGSKSHAGSTSNRKETETVENVRKPRKYTIKKYQKDQLTGDIKETKGDVEGIKRKVVKRFRKDDPEASFIVKYLSPIMTVAAERIHLSEEMRYFTESERENGKSVHGSSMFERFWKANPELLSDYSKTIVDTIEMFEERYGAGGMIPINKDFEPITSNTENQKAIDYVTSDFIDLLNYSKEIEPERNRRYEKHDRLQKEWENHFQERYGNPIEEPEIPAEEQVKPELTDLAVKEAMDKAAANNPGVKFYEFFLDDGTKLSFAINLQEVAANKLKSEYVNMPKSFVTRYTKFFLQHPKADEKLMFSLACSGKQMSEWGDVISDKDYTEEELAGLSKQITNAMSEQLYSTDELFAIMNEIYEDFETENPKFMSRVKHAIMEYSTKLSVPDKDYLKELISERYRQMEDAGLISDDISNKDKLMTYSAVYKQAMDAINSMKSHNIVYLNPRSLEAGLSFLRISNTIEDYPVEMDKIMRKYSAPLTTNERNKIVKIFMDIMINMEPSETESFKTPELSGFYKAGMEALKLKENNCFKKEFANLLLDAVVTSDNTTLRYLLDPNADKTLRDAMVEIEVSKLMQSYINIFKMLASINDELMDKYIRSSNPDLYKQLINFRQMNLYNQLFNK